MISKNTSIYIINFLLFALMSHCAGIEIYNKNDIEKEFSKIITKLNRNADNMQFLKEKRVGKSGYFYIIDISGRLIYHPQTALIGMSFGKDEQVKKIIEEQSGCFRRQMEGMTKIIIFRPLNGAKYLCLSVSPDDIDVNGLDCTVFDKK